MDASTFHELKDQVEIRQQAARKWLDDCAETMRNIKTTPVETHSNWWTQRKALLVIVLTKETSDYLAEHDPMALKQAQIAINNKSWENYLERINNA